MRIEEAMTDPALERDGQWLRWMGNMEFLLARSGSDEFDRVRNEFLKPHQEKVRFGVLEDGIWQAANRHAYARAVIRDWREVLDIDYKPVPYTWQQAEKYLSMPALHDLYDWVVFQSGQRAHFKRKVVEKDLGNSPSFSTGSANGDPSRSSSSPSSDKECPSTLSSEDPSSLQDSSTSGTPSGIAMTQTAA